MKTALFRHDHLMSCIIHLFFFKLRSCMTGPTSKFLPAKDTMTLIMTHRGNVLFAICQLLHFPSTSVVDVSLAIIMWASSFRCALSCSRKNAKSAHCPSAVVGSMHFVQLPGRTVKTKYQFNIMRCSTIQATSANLPGLCWAEIQQLALIVSSSSLHFEACNALKASDAIIRGNISL